MARPLTKPERINFRTTAERRNALEASAKKHQRTLSDETDALIDQALNGCAANSFVVHDDKIIIVRQSAVYILRWPNSPEIEIEEFVLR